MRVNLTLALHSFLSDEIFLTDPDKTISELDSFWQRNHPIIGLSVGFTELDRMSDLILDLRFYFESGKEAELFHTREKIKEAADEISRLERFGLENLL